MTETTTASRVGVWSESGRLRRVMVCSPGLAHLRLTPDNCDSLLFDDVIWVSQARRDHFDFAAKMRDRGVEVLDMLDAAHRRRPYPEGRSWVLDRRITEAQVGAGLVEPVRAWLDELPAEDLAEHLIGGLSFFDVPDDAGGPFLPALRAQEEYPFLLPPLPNTQFTQGQLLLGLPGRDTQPDVLAGASPGDAADRRDLPVPPRLRRGGLPRVVRRPRSGDRSTTARRRSRVATSCLSGVASC